MVLRLKSLVFALLLLLVPVMGCELEEEISDYYNFKVMSSNGDFSGYYSVDGEPFQYFGGEPVTATIYYSYETNLSAPSSVLISVTADTAATAVSIYVYANTQLVADITTTQTYDSGGTPLAITTTLTHDFTTSE